MSNQIATQTSKIKSTILEAYKSTQQLAPLESFKLLDEMTVKMAEYSELARLTLCASLAMIREIWDSLPLDSIYTWEYSFVEYAKATTGYAGTTVNNMVAVGNTFLLHGLPECFPAEVTLYDKNGKKLEEIVLADPYTQTASKLLMAVGVTNSGELCKDEIGLGMLFNPDVSVRDLHKYLQGDKELPKGIYLSLEGPYILAVKDGESLCVAELKNGIGFVQEGIELLLKRLKLQ